MRSRSPASTPTGEASRRQRSSASSATSRPQLRRPGGHARACRATSPGADAARLPLGPPRRAEALREAVGANTAAVLIEPIQGEAGVRPISDETLLAAREACDEVGALLILDEIQTGMGRTGSLWAYQQTPVRPDVMTSAKALGGGVPIGACLTGPDAADMLEPGDHGSTFAGGPVAASAALAVLDSWTTRRCCGGCGSGGPTARGPAGAGRGRGGARPRPNDRRRPRRAGSMPRRSAPNCSGAGSSSTCPAPSTLRLLPPLTVERAQVERAVGLIGESLLGSSG